MKILVKNYFYTKNILSKLICNPKYRVAARDRNKIIYEIDCSNCEVAYFGKCKWSLNCVQMKPKDLSGILIVKRIKLQNIVSKQITTFAGIKKKVFLSGYQVNC